MDTGEKFIKHCRDVFDLYPANCIFGIFLQGSQNYNLDNEKSDVDTKAILLPSFEEIVLNKKPISYTHIRNNNEHIDFKDIRLYIECFRKQNPNFLEILFTKYYYVNPVYKDLWNKLILFREEIARYDISRGLKALRGFTEDNFHALSHPYPSKLEILDKYGYDPKQLHHLMRIYFFIQDYLAGKPYAECLIPTEHLEYLQDLKRGILTLDEANDLAIQTREKIIDIITEALNNNDFAPNPEVDILFNEVATESIRRNLKRELN